MKKYLLLVIICMPGIFSFARQAVPGQHSLVTIAGDSAWVWLPPDHNLTDNGHRYPIVFYFPGLGTNSQEVLKQGVPRLIQSGWTATQQVPNGPKEKFIVISFTNPTGAYGPGLDFIIDSAFTKYKADTTRAYMVGASQGGTDLASYLLNSSSSYGAPSKAWILRRFKAAITLSMGNPNGQSNYSTLVPFRAKAWHAINDNITQHVFSESFINNLNQNNPGNQSQLITLPGNDHVGYHPQALDTTGTSASNNVWIWLLDPGSPPTFFYNHIGFVRNTSSYSCPTAGLSDSYDSIFSRRNYGEIAVGDTLFTQFSGMPLNGGSFYWAFRESASDPNYRAVKVNTAGIVESICMVTGTWSAMHYTSITAACGNIAQTALYAAPDDETLYNGKQLFASANGSWPANGNYAVSSDSGGLVTHTFTLNGTIMSNLQVCDDTIPPSIYNQIGLVKNTESYSCPGSAVTGIDAAAFSLRSLGEIAIGDTLFTTAGGSAIPGGSYWWAFRETATAANYRALKISSSGIVLDICLVQGEWSAVHYASSTQSCTSNGQNALYAAPDDETLYNGKRLFGSNSGSWPSNGTYYVSSSLNGAVTQSFALSATIISNLADCGGQRAAPVRPAGEMTKPNRLYPNPVAGTLYLDLNADQPVRLKIVSSHGVTVRFMNNVRSGQPVDVSAISPGVYIVLVTDYKGKELLNKKIFIKMR